MKKIIALILISMLVPVAVFADSLPEQARIEFLLKTISEADVVFIRNGEEHTAGEAASHLRMKLQNAGGKIKTAEDFINNIASKSSLTMKPYYIKLKDGTQVEAGVWLREKLKGIEDNTEEKHD